MVLTADKEVFLVVMDREDYNKKAEELLRQQTYKSIPADPTTKYKNKLITLLKTMKAEVGISMMLSIEGSILQGQDPQNSMDYQKFIKKGFH